MAVKLVVRAFLSSFDLTKKDVDVCNISTVAANVLLVAGLDFSIIVDVDEACTQGLIHAREGYIRCDAEELVHSAHDVQTTLVQAAVHRKYCGVGPLPEQIRLVEGLVGQLVRQELA